MDTCHELARNWYTGRGEKNWEKPYAAQTQALFASLGLTGEFWEWYEPVSVSPGPSAVPGAIGGR